MLVFATAIYVHFCLIFVGKAWSIQDSTLMVGS